MNIENGLSLIEKWLRNKNTIEFMGICEEMYNPNFNSLKFGRIRNSAGLNRFSASKNRSKINYHIHTDVIKQNFIPAVLLPEQISVVYASEADVLNVALFGMTAKEGRVSNPDKKGNIRDYATINKLICLSNMENLNAVFIHENLSQKESLIQLNQTAIQQMKI